MFLEPLEPRLLMSADPFGALGILDANNPATAADYQAVYNSIDVQVLADEVDLGLQFTGLAADPLIDNTLQRSAESAPQSFYTPQVIADTSSEQLHSDAATTVRQEFVFIDAGVEDYQSLLAGIQPAGSNTHYQVVFLQGDSNGIEQISAALQGQEGVDAVHVLAHGSSSGVLLGNSWLNASTLSDYEDELASWSLALDEDADLLIYGCDLASDQLGRSLLHSLADLTGADIAASDDLTGTETLGGNWELEFHLGTIETAIAVSQVAQQAWQGTLAAYESFDYGGGFLSGNNGGTGWADAWSSTSGFFTSNAGLTSPTGTLLVAGGSAEADGATFGQNRNLDAALGADGTTAWVSFLVLADTNPGAGFALVLGETADDVVTIGTDSDDFLITRDFASFSAPRIAGAITDGQTYLLVARLDFAAGNDTVTLYVDPTPGLVGPDSVLTTQLTTADLGSFTRVGLAGGFSGSTAFADEIRVGASFAEVAPLAAANIAPTFTAFAGPVDTVEEDGTRVRISFAELSAQGNEADADGTVTAFVVKAVASGSLNIGKSWGSSTPWVAGSNDVITGTDRAFWTPPANANGTLDAFTVVARDDIGAESATPVTAQVLVTAENDDPVNIGAFPAADLSVLEAGTVFVDLSGLDLADIDAGSNDVRVVLSTNSGGLLSAANGIGVVVTGSGSATLTLTGAITDLNVYMNNATGISLAVFAGIFGGDAESVDVVVNDNGNVGAGGGADVALGTVNVDITDRVVVVTTEVDELDGDTTDILTLLASPGGTGISLREAIAATNNTLITASPDWIVLPSGDYRISGGELATTDNVVIFGEGARTTFVDAEFASRVFKIDSGTTVVSGLTITRGTGYGGGAIVEAGAGLNLSDAIVTNNTGDDGGGIHVHGNLVLDGVTLSGNTATVEGGALAFHDTATGSITNSTISGNSATLRGGGLWTNVPITITNSTIAFNSSVDGGGIYSMFAGDVTLTNSILHNPLFTNSNTTLTSGGSNIDSDSSAGLGDPLDGVDPLLNALADNGGPTDTHSLQAGSQAVDPAGLVGAPANDQRGFTRDGTPDIGAFERRSQPPSLDLDGDNSTTIDNHYYSNFTEGDLPASLTDADLVFSDADSVMFDAVTLDATEILDGNVETLILDGSTFMLATAVLGQNTAGANYFVAMTVGPGTASVTITRAGGGQFTTAEVETLIRAIRYQHTDDENPTAGVREIDVRVDDGVDLSASAIALFDVDPVNDVPTLTSFLIPATVTSEDTEIAISFLDLIATGDENDVDGTVDAFVVQGVSSGTLLIGTSSETATVWAAGTNDTIESGSNAYWTPDGDATGTLNAFTVVARDDGGLESAPAVTVQVGVTNDNDAPTFTAFSGPVASTSEDTVVAISLADLLAQGDENDIDGSVTAFVVKGVINGTLTIGADAGSATAWVEGVNDVIDAANEAFWTPDPASSGTINVFSVVARDNVGLESAPPVTAQVVVASVNMAPTFTLLAGPVDTTAQDTAVEISLADLLAQGNESDVDGSVTAFVVTAINSGTLTIGVNSVLSVAWVAGVNDTIDATNRAFWNPDAGSTGDLNAFSIVARDDGGLTSTPAVIATVTVTAGNEAPGFTVFTGAVDSTAEDTFVAISRAELRAASDASDADGSIDAFVVRGVSSGTLSIGADRGSASAWTAGLNDVIDATNLAFWTPAADANGSLDAFSVVARDDGGLVSLDAVTAQVNVSAVNDAPTFTMLSDSVATAAQETEVAISLAELLALSDASDVDSELQGFIVRAVGAGTLRIGSTSDTAVAWLAGSNDIITASSNAYWTPDADDTDTLNAFVIVAVDAEGLASDGPVTAQVDVTAVEPPIEPPVEPPVEPPPTQVLTPQDLANLGPQVNEETPGREEPSEPEVAEPRAETEEPEEEGSDVDAVAAPVPEGFSGTAFVGGGSDNEISDLSGRFDDGSFSELVTLFGDSSDFSSLSTAVVDSDIPISPAFQPITIGDAGASFDSFVDPLVLIGSKNFSDGLDKMREELQQELVLDQTMLGGTVTVTAGFSVGYLVWLTRSGALLGAALSALPAWRFMDPLPILANSNFSEDEVDEESLESMVNQVNDEQEASLEEPQEEELESSP